MRNGIGFALGAGLACLATLAFAQDAPVPAQSAYSLFNPTPDAQLRSLCTDRPTKSTGPCTVDAGRWQVEIDLYDATLQRQNGVRTLTESAAAPNLKLGLTDRLDLEASLAPIVQISVRDAGATHRIHGGGDLYLRAKYSLAGVDGGALAAAISPYVKWPTAAGGVGDGSVEGGVTAPLQWTLADGTQLLTDPEADSLTNASGRGAHLNLVNLISVTRPISKTFALSAELWTDANFEPNKTVTQASLDLGAAWSPSAWPNWQLDGGVNIGLNHSTPGLQVYFGVSHRL